MALIFMDGFDKYGPVNANAVGSLMAGEWTTVSSALQIAAGLSYPGYSLLMTTNQSLSKSFSSNYARLIGGMRLNTDLGNSAVINFRDTSNVQCTIQIDNAGFINLRTGTIIGSIIATSIQAVSAGAIHYLEWDISFGTSASYQIWLDGVSILSGTGNTRGGSTNNYANSILINQVNVGNWIIDDLYFFDSTGSTNNAALLSWPRIETTFPASDNAVQFTPGPGILGSNLAVVNINAAPTANSMILRAFVPTVACTLNSISLVYAVSNGSIRFRPLIYTDSSGVAGTLLSTGSIVTGVVASTPLVVPLTTPQSLVAGTRYWIGFMTDTTVNMEVFDGNNAGVSATATFASGAPGTAPAMVAASTYFYWGNVTGVTGNNWELVNDNPPPGLLSYVSDGIVGEEDLYNFGAMSAIPAAIHAVAVKGYISKTDSGTKLISLRMKSGAVDDDGTANSIAPGTSFSYLSTMFETDPNTGSAWTAANLNAAKSGIKIDV